VCGSLRSGPNSRRAGTADPHSWQQHRMSRPNYGRDRGRAHTYRHICAVAAQHRSPVLAQAPESSRALWRVVRCAVSMPVSGPRPVRPCSRRTTSGVSFSVQYGCTEADSIRLPEIDRRLGCPHLGPRDAGSACGESSLPRSSRANSTIQDCCPRAGSRYSGSRSIRDRHPSARGSAHARARARLA
jgi:hypothetical protein